MHAYTDTQALQNAAPPVKSQICDAHLHMQLSHFDSSPEL